MPTVLRIGPYRFAFFANEGTEPPHIHVYAAEHEAKYWLLPILLDRNVGFRSGELATIGEILAEHREFILEKWHDFHERPR